MQNKSTRNYFRKPWSFGDYKNKGAIKFLIKILCIFNNLKNIYLWSPPQSHSQTFHSNFMDHNRYSQLATHSSKKAKYDNKIIVQNLILQISPNP